jgi:hypothetical protein
MERKGTREWRVGFGTHREETSSFPNLILGETRETGMGKSRKGGKRINLTKNPLVKPQEIGEVRRWVGQKDEEFLGWKIEVFD